MRATFSIRFSVALRGRGQLPRSHPGHGLAPRRGLVSKHAARLMDAYVRPSPIWGQIADEVAREHQGSA